MLSDSVSFWLEIDENKLLLCKAGLQCGVMYNVAKAVKQIKGFQTRALCYHDNVFKNK